MMTLTSHGWEHECLAICSRTCHLFRTPDMVELILQYLVGWVAQLQGTEVFHKGILEQKSEGSWQDGSPERSNTQE